MIYRNALLAINAVPYLLPEHIIAVERLQYQNETDTSEHMNSISGQEISETTVTRAHSRILTLGLHYQQEPILRPLAAQLNAIQLQLNAAMYANRGAIPVIENWSAAVTAFNEFRSTGLRAAVQRQSFLGNIVSFLSPFLVSFVSAGVIIPAAVITQANSDRSGNGGRIITIVLKEVSSWTETTINGEVQPNPPISVDSSNIRPGG